MAIQFIKADKCSLRLFQFLEFLLKWTLNFFSQVDENFSLFIRSLINRSEAQTARPKLILVSLFFSLREPFNFLEEVSLSNWIDLSLFSSEDSIQLQTRDTF